MPLGTSRTQIWALWKPEKPKGDFQWVQIKDISETLFLLQIALGLTPKELKSPTIPILKSIDVPILCSQRWTPQN